MYLSNEIFLSHMILKLILKMHFLGLVHLLSFFFPKDYRECIANSAFRIPRSWRLKQATAVFPHSILKELMR